MRSPRRTLSSTSYSHLSFQMPGVMQKTKTKPVQLLDLPYEIRSQIFHDALTQRLEVAACSCVDAPKTEPFLGRCVNVNDLRRYVLDFSTPIHTNRQFYQETYDIAACQPAKHAFLILGGTKCLQLFLKNLPKQHPRTISLLLRLCVSNQWLRTTSWGPNASLKYMDSVIGALGIGTEQEYTAKTTSTLLLPKNESSELQVMEARVTLMMLGRL